MQAEASFFFVSLEDSTCRLVERGSRSASSAAAARLPLIGEYKHLKLLLMARCRARREFLSPCKLTPQRLNVPRANRPPLSASLSQSHHLHQQQACNDFSYLGPPPERFWSRSRKPLSHLHNTKCGGAARASGGRTNRKEPAAALASRS